jgi:hypothetical protein
MQVNLKHHPEAFANLDVAFEPATNTDYAARFLVQLHDQTGDWTKATANYHSAVPAEGGPYADKVASVWPEEQRKAGMAPLPLAGTGFARAGMAGPLARGLPPVSGNPPPRMYAMAGKLPMGTMPVALTPGGMASGETSRGGIAMKGGAPTFPLIAPPGMMRGGTTGTLPPGGIANAGVTRVGATAPTAAAEPLTISPGRGLAFYRAMPIAVMTSTIRPPALIGNRVTAR